MQYPSIKKKWMVSYPGEMGASSVLIIMMLLALMVFGLAMLTTAMAQLRLSEHHQMHQSFQYELEALAQKRLADLDAGLVAAEQLTVAYMQQFGSVVEAMGTQGLALDEAQKTYFDGLENRSDQINYLYEIMPEVYRWHVNYVLEAWLEPVDPLDPLSISSVVGLTENEVTRYLTIGLTLRLPAYTITYDGLVVGLKPSPLTTSRFTTRTYVTWQPAFEYEETIKFGNPFDRPNP